MVNNKKHLWNRDGNLFIFDDTILHQSFNLTDLERNCLFIDILRPSFLAFILNKIMFLLGYLSIYVPFFRKSSQWDVKAKKL